MRERTRLDGNPREPAGTHNFVIVVARKIRCGVLLNQHMSYPITCYDALVSDSCGAPAARIGASYTKTNCVEQWPIRYDADEGGARLPG